MKWIIPTNYYFSDGQRIPFRAKCAVASEDGRFTINRSPQDGFVPAGGSIVYTLVDRGQIVGMERGVADTHDAKLAAIARLKAITGDLNA